MVRRFFPSLSVPPGWKVAVGRQAVLRFPCPSCSGCTHRRCYCRPSRKTSLRNKVSDGSVEVQVTLDLPPGVELLGYEPHSPGSCAARWPASCGPRTVCWKTIVLRTGSSPASPCVVRQHGPRARAWARVFDLSRLCELREPPVRAQGCETLLLAGDHLGQKASHPGPQRKDG